MKNKIVTLIIVWLIVAIAATSSIALIQRDRGEKLAAKVSVEQEKVQEQEKDDQQQKESKRDRGKIDSPLRSKEEILTDLDQGMENIIFEEQAVEKE